MRLAGVQVQKMRVHAANGHDSFLTEPELYEKAIAAHLAA